MLASPELDAFFQQSPSFRAVICDWVAIEIYQAQSVEDLRASLRIVGQHADRVLVLKGGLSCARLSGRDAGLTRRMIDNSSTRDFVRFCSSILNDDKVAAQFLREKGKQSTESLDEALAFARQMPAIVNDLARNYFTASEVASLRQGGRLKTELVGKFLRFVERVAGDRLEAQQTRLPRTHIEWVNSFVFRLSVATMVNVLKWFRTGRITETDLHNASKTRNDHVDATIATYATYFDGVLSNDKRLLSVYAETSAILGLMSKATK